MRWYSHLFVGEKAKKQKRQIIGKIRKKILQSEVHVITLAENGENLFDIYPSEMLLTPYYKEKDFYIIGIAADYWEALDVARDIVDAMYQKTGTCCWSEFVEE